MPLDLVAGLQIRSPHSLRFDHARKVEAENRWQRMSEAWSGFAGADLHDQADSRRSP
jgi:hypothetical protein